MTEKPTEKDCRDAGMTKAALDFPLSDAAMAERCTYNGIMVEQAPPVWRYAPNPYVRDYWERKATMDAAAFDALYPKGPRA